MSRQLWHYYSFLARIYNLITMIRFKQHREKAVLHNPLKGFAVEEQPIEYRVDPLTGLASTFHARPASSPVIYQVDETVVEKLSSETRTNCLFCPDKAGTATPKFPSELIPEGRMTRGEATMFPNLFAQKGHSAVIALTRKHFLRLNEFTPDVLYNALKLAEFYLRRAYEVDKIRYAEIGQNYLYPSGSSVPHPHIQALASHWPYYLLTLSMEKAKAHYQNYSCNYWDELMRKERRLKVRYLGRLGSTEWFTPFAPSRHDEVNFVVRGKSHFLEFADADWKNLAEGLSRVLRAYHDAGLSCFNFAMYSAPMGQKLNYFWAGGKIVSRSSVQTFPTSDVWYGPNILLYGFITVPPEEVAKTIRPYFIES